MGKSSFFTGQPIFGQVLSYIPRSSIKGISRQYKADRYCKRFTTYDHLVTLLYAILNQCTSLREVSTGLLAWEQRLVHLGIRYPPRRSTIADANKRRNEVVFEKIYLSLLTRYGHFLPDSRRSKRDSRLYIFDSTTISLFQEVLKASGLSRADGRRKGGIKVHTLMRMDQDVPCMIRFSASAANDATFLKTLELPQGSIVVFDKGYRDYTTYNRLSEQKVTWITRHRPSSVYKIITERPVSEAQQQKGVLADWEILLGHDHQKKATKVKARLIQYKDTGTGKVFEFLSNHPQLAPATIADCYRKRWQIELLFKRIKQNYPLKYFLGDSENAIKIQIWCVLIADLLMKIIKKATGCKWAFSNLTAMVRLHMMTYLNLKRFLQEPEKSLLIKMKHQNQTQNYLSLFPT